MPGDLKEALASIAPIAWDDLPSDPELPDFLNITFKHAETIVNSIPCLAAPAGSSFTPSPANSAQNAQETFVKAEEVPMPEYDRSASAVKDWGKPYKLGAKDNPLQVQCYKMAAHDRHGAYFARRSVHQGIGFDRWRRCAEREFLESLKVQDGPGAGAVRGISADRRVVKKEVPGVGTLEVWQTSSAFPGPVTPRESLTLVISATAGLSNMPDGSKPPRHFLVISRPSSHDDAPNRQNLVKMTYESAEVVREIPIPGNDDPESNPVEWLMVTRSDPGGGIPKFMVERGTPSSITGDVVKFLNWATKKPWSELEDDGAEDAEIEKANAATDHVEGTQIHNGEVVATASNHQSHDAATREKADAHANAGQDVEESGLAAKATGAAGTVGALAAGAASYIRGATFGLSKNDDSDDISIASSSSSGTFASALDEPDLKRHRHVNIHADGNGDEKTPRTSFAPDRGSLDSNSNSSKTTLAGKNPEASRSSKELSRLMQKRQSIDMRAEKDRAAIEKKIAAANEKDAAAREKAVAKQERERARQTDRYEREIAKLDARRVKEEQKEEQRRQKAANKDELLRLRREVGEWKERADVAEKEAGLLREQLEALQREHTAAAARLSPEAAKSVQEELGGGGSGRGKTLAHGEKSLTT